MASAQRKVEVLEKVLELMDECADELESLEDRKIGYWLADFEGRGQGWVAEGQLVRDELEDALMDAQQEVARPGQ